MKKLLFLLFLNFTFALGQNTDASLLDLKGKVKQVKYYNKEVLVKTINFNEKGTISASKMFNLGKTVSAAESKFDSEGFKIVTRDDIMITHFKYDNLHNIIKTTNLNAANNDTLDDVRDEYLGKNLIKRISYDFRYPQKRMKDMVLFFYDDAGLLIKEVNYTVSNIVKNKPYKGIEDKAPITFFYVYDNNKNLLEKIGKDESGNVTSRVNYAYDAGNRKIEYQTYYPNSTASRRETFAYDAQGNLTENTSYDSVGELIYTDNYSYDAKNNLLKRTHLYQGTITTATEFEYDSNGNPIQEKRYLKGKLTDIKMRKFDTIGNEIYLKIVDASGKTIAESKREISYY